MEKGEYFKIISNIPIDHEVDFLEAEMKIAERDHFCKPQTFIRELTQAIDELKKDRILKAAIKTSELEYDIKTAYDCGNKSSYDLGFDVLENETYEEYHKRETERRITGWKSELETVGDDAFKDFVVLNNYQSKVNELEKIIQTAGNDLPPLTRSLKLEEQEFLFQELKNKGFIDQKEDFKNFCFAFGGNSINKEFKKIKWTKSKQCLRNLLSEIKFHNDADMLRAVEYYFLDQRGQKMKLPNNRKDPCSGDQIIISEILDSLKSL